LKHIALTFRSVKDLQSILELHRAKIASAHSVLAQVFVSKVDEDWIRSLGRVIRRFSEKIVVIGATTAGEICRGESHDLSHVISLSFFKSTQVVPFAVPIPPHGEKVSGAALVDQLQALSLPVKGLILFATPMGADCNVLMSTVHNLWPGLPLIGGGAGDYGQLIRACVFSGEEVMESGLVAAALMGDDLHFTRHTFLGWSPIGKEMKATKVEGLVLKEIDGIPAFDIGRKYFDVQAADNLLLGMLEFPLLVRRGGRLLARTPIGITADGGVVFSTDIREGEILQFGYGNIDMIFDQSRAIRLELEQFAPEAIFIYSCITRRFILQEDVDIELRSYDCIAPSAGFFTHGEFCDLGDMSPQLNTNIAIAALREGGKKPVWTSSRKRAAEVKPPDLYHQRYNRIMSRFRYFIAAVTDDLAQANLELRKQLEEIKMLRGILPICTCCKKIRDDKGYWNQLEIYIRDHSDAEFSHGLCPECALKLYPDYVLRIHKQPEK